MPFWGYSRAPIWGRCSFGYRLVAANDELQSLGGAFVRRTSTVFFEVTVRAKRNQDCWAGRGVNDSKEVIAGSVKPVLPVSEMRREWHSQYRAHLSKLVAKGCRLASALNCHADGSDCNRRCFRSNIAAIHRCRVLGGWLLEIRATGYCQC